MDSPGGLDALPSPSTRLRVVSNFGDGDCGAGKIHTHARESTTTRRRDAKGAPKIAKIRDYSQSILQPCTCPFYFAIAKCKLR